jgi:hypothetical protein
VSSPMRQGAADHPRDESTASPGIRKTAVRRVNSRPARKLVRDLQFGWMMLPWLNCRRA